jgi:pectin methylesterase-like acyl-CoA thioesterase
MGPKLLVWLGICLTVASLLLSCTPSQSAAPVTEAPDRVIAIRDAALNYITEKYNLASFLPSTEYWQAGEIVPGDQPDRRVYTFTAGDWTIHIQVPVDTTEICCIKLIFAMTGFEWNGTVDENMAVTEVSYAHWVRPKP